MNEKTTAGLTAALLASAPALEHEVKTRIRSHWDEKAPTFDRGESRVSRDPEIYEAWRGIFREVLGPSPKRILDVGSGTGELALLFHDLGHRPCGTDISPGMVGVSRAKAEARGVPVEFRVGDAELLPFADRTFDVVHARHLLWTLPHPRKALAEWIRVLRPGGIVLVTESVWDGAPPRLPDRMRERIGRAVGALLALLPGLPGRGPRRRRSYPGRDRLPFYGGLGRRGLESFLREGGLLPGGSRDLLWLRERSRGRLPWYRRWANGRKHEYYLAWGRRP